VLEPQNYFLISYSELFFFFIKSEIMIPAKLKKNDKVNEIHVINITKIVN